MRKSCSGVSCLIVLLAWLASAKPMEIIPPDFRGAKQPQITATAAGEIGVTFGRENSVYLVRSKDGAKTFSQPQLIGSVEKLALGMRRGPRIAAVGKDFVISAISHNDGNLYGWIPSEADGHWKRTRINDAPHCAREGLHAMASDGQNKILCAWLDLRNHGTELWGSLSSDTGKAWSKNFRIYQSPDGHICECCHPSVIFTPSGEVIAMWRNWLGGSRDMYWASSSDGKNFGSSKKLGAGTWQLNACPMDGGALFVGPVGRALSLWRREKKILLADGNASEDLISATGSQPVAASGQGKNYLLWQQDKNLKLKIFPAPTPVSTLAENAAYPAIVFNPLLRTPVAVWEAPASKSIFADILK